VLDQQSALALCQFVAGEPLQAEVVAEVQSVRGLAHVNELHQDTPGALRHHTERLAQ